MSSPCEVTNELKEICIKAAKAVKGQIVSVDLFETKKGLMVNEVNAVTEFRKSIEAYKVDIPNEIAKYIMECVK